MTVTDPIADLLTRIRNANTVRHSNVEIPASNLKVELVKLLREEGLKRVSTPGLRTYSKAKNLPRVFDGLGIAVVSTSKGLLTDKTARKENIGGEVLCYVW